MNWLRRLFRRKPRFPLPPPEMCEACNHPTDDPHTITETFDEGDGTGTEMTAIYCGEHCPGRCDHVHRDWFAEHERALEIERRLAWPAVGPSVEQGATD